MKQKYSAFEIDDDLLGYFEDIGNNESKKLIDIDMIYDTFSWYIKIIWENPAVQEYIKWQRSEGADIYDGFEYIYNKSKSYGEAKEKKEPLWIWRLKWRLCKK